MQIKRFFHLLIESPEKTAGCTYKASGDGINGFDSIEIPNDINYLKAERGRRPRLVPRRDCDTDNCFALQPVWDSQPPRLLVLIPERRCAWVNGQPAPPVLLLNEKDEVSFDRNGEWICHLTLFNLSVIGSPDTDMVGKKCPVCRMEINRDTDIYVCFRCGQAIHCEEEEQGAERFTCARLSTKCPICETPINLKSGYSYIPAFSRA